MQQAQIERAILVQQRPMHEPFEQDVAIGRGQYLRQRVVAAQARAAVRNGQQVQIVVAQRDRCGRSQGADAPQNLQRCGPAIDQIAHEPKPVPVRREAHLLEQRIELGIAALHVADCIERHHRVTPAPSAELRASPA